MRVPENKGGKKGMCPKCARVVYVPHSQTEADASKEHRAELVARRRGRRLKREEGDPSPQGLDGPPHQADPEAAHRSAEAPSAPPMSWPVESPPLHRIDGRDAVSDLGASPLVAVAAEDDAGPGPEGPAAGGADTPLALLEPAATAGVRGAHGLLGLLAMLIVVMGVVGLVAWRNWEHARRFSDVITHCLPSVAFPADGIDNRAIPKGLRGKVLLCDEFGGPYSLRQWPDSRILAPSADQAGSVIFVRRNDHAPGARTFRVGGRVPPRAPVGYEMCAVDVRSGRRICAAVVFGADDILAVEALCRLIEISVR